MQIHTVPEYEIAIDPIIHVSQEISTLLSCEIVGFPGLNVLFVCLFVCCYPGVSPERLSKCALLISASSLPICVIFTITNFYENRQGSSLILREMCAHVKPDAYTKESLV